MPEWYALMHECQQSQQSSDIPEEDGDEEDTAEHSQKTSVILHDPAATTDVGSGSGGDDDVERKCTPVVKTPPTHNGWGAVRTAANNRLRQWAEHNLLQEHRFATVLNPRLRHLPLICSPQER